MIRVCLLLLRVAFSSESQKSGKSGDTDGSTRKFHMATSLLGMDTEEFKMPEIGLYELTEDDMSIYTKKSYASPKVKNEKLIKGQIVKIIEVDSNDVRIYGRIKEGWIKMIKMKNNKKEKSYVVAVQKGIDIPEPGSYVVLGNGGRHVFRKPKDTYIDFRINNIVNIEGVARKGLEYWGKTQYGSGYGWIKMQDFSNNKFYIVSKDIYDEKQRHEEEKKKQRMKEAEKRRKKEHEEAERQKKNEEALGKPQNDHSVDNSETEVKDLKNDENVKESIWQKLVAKYLLMFFGLVIVIGIVYSFSSSKPNGKGIGGDIGDFVVGEGEGTVVGESIDNAPAKPPLFFSAVREKFSNFRSKLKPPALHNFFTGFLGKISQIKMIMQIMKKFITTLLINLTRAKPFTFQIKSQKVLAFIKRLINQNRAKHFQIKSQNALAFIKRMRDQVGSQLTKTPPKLTDMPPELIPVQPSIPTQLSYAVVAGMLAVLGISVCFFWLFKKYRPKKITESEIFSLEKPVDVKRNSFSAVVEPDNQKNVPTEEIAEPQIYFSVDKPVKDHVEIAKNPENGGVNWVQYVAWGAPALVLIFVGIYAYKRIFKKAPRKIILESQNQKIQTPSITTWVEEENELPIDSLGSPELSSWVDTIYNEETTAHKQAVAKRNQYDGGIYESNESTDEEFVSNPDINPMLRDSLDLSTSSSQKSSNLL